MTKKPAKPNQKAAKEAKPSSKPVAQVSEADRKAAAERLEQYIKDSSEGQLSLRDRVIQALRRLQSQNKESKLVALAELAKALKPWPDDVLKDARAADGKTSDETKGKQLLVNSVLLKAVHRLENDGLIVSKKEGYRLADVKLSDDLSFKISPDLIGWLPPQLEEELSALERSLLIDGPEDPLHVWQEKNVLIDGHTRVNILLRHGRLDQVKKLAETAVKHSFPDLDAVRAWMEERQGARRNQSRMAMMYFLGHRYNREKQQGARTDLKTSAENERKSTDERLAKEYGVTASTVRRAGVLAANIDRLQEVADQCQKGRGAVLRTLLLRQRVKGGPKVTERTINATASESNVTKQERMVEALLEGKAIAKSGKNKGLFMFRMPRNDAGAQAKALSKIKREDLEKLRDVIDAYLAKPES